MTALHYAVASNNIAGCELLLQKGARVNQKDKLGRRAVHFCVGKGFYTTLVLLIKNGADMNVQGMQVAKLGSFKQGNRFFKVLAFIAFDGNMSPIKIQNWWFAFNIQPAPFLSSLCQREPLSLSPVRTCAHRQKWGYTTDVRLFAWLQDVCAMDA
eukprot:1157418-Pelagomonas_calceolata.AAC.11